MVPYEIITPAGTRAVLNQYGLYARKKLGQHFLVDPRVLDKIIHASQVNEGDCVLEIGPGIGAVTQALLKKAAKVCAVELDHKLIPVLQSLFGEELSLIHGDILKLNLHELLAPFVKMPLKVVANLPYYITTAVIMHLLEKGPAFTSVTVMMQREVAMRMAARPGVKDYGSLSLAAGYYADIKIAAHVPSHCFMPRPAVDSAVVHMEILPEPRVKADTKLLFQIIHSAFNQRRKTLVNALSADKGLALSKEKIAGMLEQCGLDANIRGEALDIHAFAGLANMISSGSKKCPPTGAAHYSVPKVTES